MLFDDPDADQLVELVIEEPDEAIQFHNWQQYLAHLMLWAGESFDDDGFIKRMADLIQFGYVDELFNLWERIGDLPYDEYEGKCRSFVAAIGE